MSPLRVVIHGCGGRASGFWVPRLLRQPDVRIVGLCDFNVALCQALRDKHFAGMAEPPRIFEDPRTMYDVTRPDIAVIVTAHTLHEEHCRMALDAGCHIAVEKPMATTYAQAVGLARQVEAVDRVFQVGFNFPYSERSNDLRHAIRRGEFGRVQSINASISQSWRTMHRNTWRMDPSLSGGGFLHDTGTHLLQAMLFLHPGEPVEVFARIDSLDCPVDINSAVQVRFDDDTVASLSFCGNAPGRCRIGVALDAGGIEFTSLHGHDATAWDSAGHDVALPAFDKSIRHEHNLLDAIRGTATVRTGYRDGLRVCELVEAAYESAHRGQLVRLNPAGE